jgi:hypothetical protein
VLAGTGTVGNAGDGGLASDAQLTEPNALALDEARARLYVGQYELDQSASPRSRIRVIDLGTETIDAWVTGLNRIQQLSVGPGGELYVAKESDNHDDGFYEVDPDTREVSQFLRSGRYESNEIHYNYSYEDCGVAAQDDGKVLISALLGGDAYLLPRSPPYGYGIARYSVESGPRLERVVGAGWSVEGCPDNCVGGEGSALDLAVSPARSLVLHGKDLYFIERAQNRVRMVQGGKLTTIFGGGTDTQDYVSARGAALSDPRALAVTPEGHVVVADSGNNEVRLVW